MFKSSGQQTETLLKIAWKRIQEYLYAIIQSSKDQ